MRAITPHSVVPTPPSSDSELESINCSRGIVDDRTVSTKSPSSCSKEDSRTPSLLFSGGGEGAVVVALSLDALADKEDHAARVTATADAHAAILAEQAVSNLVTPEWHVSLSDCVVDYVPWGSDYYVIRPDLFVPAATPCTRPQLSSDGAGATRAVLAGAAALLAAVFLH